jgi:hypothetical protein
MPGTHIDEGRQTTLLQVLALANLIPNLVASGLAYQATVTTYTDTTHFKATALIGLGDNFFYSSTQQPWSVYPVWKATGTGGAPQGEIQPVAAFTSADGTVQHTAFTVHLVLNDKVLMLHPAIAYMLQMGTLVNTGGTATLAAILGDLTNVSLATQLTNLKNQCARTTPKKSLASITTANMFTVSGGMVKIISLPGNITTGIQAVANATKLQFTPTGGVAVDLCATLDLNNAAVGKILGIDGVKADPMTLSADVGVKVGSLTSVLILPPGVISMNCAVTTTGAIDWYVEFMPLAPGAIVS